MTRKRWTHLQLLFGPVAPTFLAFIGCHRRLRHETAQTATSGTRLSKIMPIL